jgi:hypothetical protein
MPPKPTLFAHATIVSTFASDKVSLAPASACPSIKQSSIWLYGVPKFECRDSAAAIADCAISHTDPETTHVPELTEP